jgi:UDP-glucose 4-epimerase
MKKRVLITGGAGLIGSQIADLLVREEDPDIVVLDNFTRGRRENLAWAVANGRVEIVEGDICDPGLVAEVMQGVHEVYHQAAIRITQCAEAPRLAVDVLVNGTFNIVEAAARFGAHKIVAASSASVYGLADEFPTRESHHPYHNKTLYGAAKVFNEGLLASFHDMYKLSYTCLRYFNVYGPRMDTYGAYTEVLIRWMERIAAGQSPLILGNGKQTMDFIFVEDVARANVLAMKADVSAGAFNVASGCETSLNELAACLGKVMGSDLTPEHGPERSVNAVSRRLAYTSLAEEKIGFRARIPLEEGLGRLVSWWMASRTVAAHASA